MEPVPHEKTDRDGLVRHFVDQLCSDFPPHMRADMREKVLAWLDNTILRMLKDSEPGDELWICRSRYIGPLAGHEGLGIVRSGTVLKYEPIIHY
jgi:hypothetical protein